MPFCSSVLVWLPILTSTTHSSKRAKRMLGKNTSSAATSKHSIHEFVPPSATVTPQPVQGFRVQKYVELQWDLFWSIPGTEQGVKSDPLSRWPPQTHCAWSITSTWYSMAALVWTPHLGAVEHPEQQEHYRRGHEQRYPYTAFERLKNLPPRNLRKVKQARVRISVRDNGTTQTWH